MGERGPARSLATDVDDVLVQIGIPWVERSLLQPRIGAWLGPLLPRGGGLGEAVLARPMYYIQTWLSEVYKFPPELAAEFEAVYREDGAFYDDLPPTAFCRGIITALEASRALSEVHVISQIYAEGDPATASKRRWLDRWLRPSEFPVTIHMVTGSQKKSGVLLQHCPSPDVFADDAMKNVIDVLLAKGVRPGEILVPRMGHNSPVHRDVAHLAALRNTAVTHYLHVL